MIIGKVDPNPDMSSWSASRKLNYFLSQKRVKPIRVTIERATYGFGVVIRDGELYIHLTNEQCKQILEHLAA
jgi:hypothetical protein